MEFVWFGLIGIAAGFLAGLLFKGRSMGVLWNLVLGIVGAMIGGQILKLFNFEPTLLIQLIASAAGAIIVLWVFFSFRGK